MFGKVRCKKCGKVLNSVTLTYGGDWLCGECADNKESILFCERGSKVKAVKLDSGYKGDVEQAYKFLKQDVIYEVESIESAVIYRQSISKNFLIRNLTQYIL